MKYQQVTEAKNILKAIWFLAPLVQTHFVVFRLGLCSLQRWVIGGHRKNHIMETYDDYTPRTFDPDAGIDHDDNCEDEDNRDDDSNHNDGIG